MAVFGGLQSAGKLVWATVKGLMIGAFFLVVVAVACVELRRVLGTGPESMIAVAAGVYALIVFAACMVILTERLEGGATEGAKVAVRRREEVRMLIGVVFVFPPALVLLLVGVHGVHRIADLVAAEVRVKEILVKAEQAKDAGVPKQLNKLAAEIELAAVATDFRRPAVLGRFDAYAPLVGALLLAVTVAISVAMAICRALPADVTTIVRVGVFGVAVALAAVAACVVYAARFRDSYDLITELPISLMRQ